MSVAHSEVTREASDGGRQPCSSPALWGWWYRGQKQRNRHTRLRYGWRGLDDAGRSEVRWSGRGGGKGKSSRTLTHLGTEGRRNGMHLQHSVSRSRREGVRSLGRIAAAVHGQQTWSSRVVVEVVVWMQRRGVGQRGLPWWSRAAAMER